MDKHIRRLIWIYFITLMLEGVFRKWLTPGLTNELLLIREPVVLTAYIMAFSQMRFPREKPAVFAIILGIFCLGISLIFLNVHMYLAIFGFKASYLHIPMIYLFPRYFNREDVIQMGFWVLIAAIPNGILMVLQFGGDYNHVLNATGGGGPGQMEGALGRVRPPGLFSFITGAAQFLAIALAFAVFGFINRGYFTNRLLYLVTFVLIISLAVSISRLALGSALMVLASVMVIAFLGKDQKLKVVLQFGIPLLILGLAATQLEIFSEGQQAFESRLMLTGDFEAGLGGTALNWYQRTLNDLTGGLYLIDDVAFLGHGLGMGTNFGARFTTGKLQFLLAEGEWARIILEVGPILGLLTIMIRLAVVWLMLKLSLKALAKGNQLPILLFGGSFLLVVSGQWGQSTTLGFAILGAGLTFAATRMPEISRTPRIR